MVHECPLRVRSSDWGGGVYLPGLSGCDLNFEIPASTPIAIWQKTLDVRTLQQTCSANKLTIFDNDQEEFCYQNSQSEYAGVNPGKDLRQGQVLTSDQTSKYNLRILFETKTTDYVAGKGFELLIYKIDSGSIDTNPGSQFSQIFGCQVSKLNDLQTLMDIQDSIGANDDERNEDCKKKCLQKYGCVSVALGNDNKCYLFGIEAQNPAIISTTFKSFFNKGSKDSAVLENIDFEFKDEFRYHCPVVEYFRSINPIQKQTREECALLCKASNACGSKCTFYKFCEGSCIIGDLTRDAIDSTNGIVPSRGSGNCLAKTVGVGTRDKHTCKIRVRDVAKEVTENPIETIDSKYTN